MLVKQRRRDGNGRWQRWCWRSGANGGEGATAALLKVVLKVFEHLFNVLQLLSVGRELAWLGGGSRVSGSVGRRRGLASMNALHILAVEARQAEGWTRRQRRDMARRRRHARLAALRTA